MEVRHVPHLGSVHLVSIHSLDSRNSSGSRYRIEVDAPGRTRFPARIRTVFSPNGGSVLAERDVASIDVDATSSGDYLIQVGSPFIEASGGREPYRMRVSTLP